ncbi:hypothetical protein IC229_12035 [Spirosoma sp. BT702]|uniref:Uncharacterized protein n=1 Tax=Spirosoma profusum TaxID=2771354 RepID=A0A926XZZ7_9BACT|nr:choice-of-anchor Q domain-containing protein [Spirosoma profusum]MBD2701372.1 hypothetical protein [Spirosoma profusum]
MKFSSTRLIGLYLLISLTSVAAFAQTIRYVKPTSTGTGDGSSWDNASSNLQAIINASASGNQVWVAGGTYKPTTTTNKGISFSMKNGVAIYGGFAGNETSLNGRLTVINSILSGDIGVVGSSNDNSYHVISNPPGLTNSAILDGFVIRDGVAFPPSGEPNNQGGGMYNNGSGAGNVCSPTIRNCHFINNSASYGGAIYNDANLDASSSNGTSSPVLINCSFVNNSAFQGGAIYSDSRNFGTVNLVVINCSFLNNSYTVNGTGGAFRNEGTSFSIINLTLTNCVFFGNGGANTFSNNGTVISANYSLFEPSVIGYNNGSGNATTTTSPFLTSTNTQLLAGSAAIDVGDPNTTTATVGTIDLAGSDRFKGRIDMGAYEYCDPTTRLYVRASATGANTGLNWTNAFPDLQSALNYVSKTCNLEEIWVAGGTYKPTSTTDRTISFSMSPNVRIIGGFVGNESVLSQRPTINLTTPSATTLSGDIGTAGDITDNTYHVIRMLTGESFWLDGFVITGGNANGSSPNNMGGGMYSNGTPDIRNCLFINNKATNGGGVYNFSSSTESTKFAGCVFQNNSASGVGGAMDNEACRVEVDGCRFKGNTASSQGGGVYSLNCQLLWLYFRTTEFESNSASFGGGMRNWTSSPIINNCTFKGNSAGSLGGGILNFSFSISFINNSIFLGNTASQGGGVCNETNSTGSFTNCSLSGNSATNGGGVANLNSSSEFLNCILWGNSTGIYNDAESFFNYKFTLIQNMALGAGIFNGITNPLFVNQPPIGLGTAGSLRLKANSPAVNAGDPGTSTFETGPVDLLGRPRFVGQIDLGAYELPAEIYTLKNGLWNDPTVWSGNQLPALYDYVRLKHVVTIPASYQAQVGTLLYDSGGKLTVNSAAKLQIEP